MDNPNVLYVRHTNDGVFYRVRGVYAQREKARLEMKKVGQSHIHPEWGEVKNKKIVKMRLEDVQPVMTLDSLKKYESKMMNP